MRIITLITCTTKMILLGACVYVPPVWDVADEIYYVEGIEDGVTTKKEVLEKLGEPTYQNKDQNTLYYSGEASLGYLFLSMGYTGVGGLLGDHVWWIEIQFDENDVVDRFMTSSEVRAWEYPEQLAKGKSRQLNRRAQKGDAESQFQIYKNRPPSDETLRWLCLAANQGHPLAQEEMGDLNRSKDKGDSRIENSMKPNDTMAYVWYSLAASNGLKRAAFVRKQMSKDMTNEEIVEAGRLVAKWKPDPAGCTTPASESEKLG